VSGFEPGALELRGVKVRARHTRHTGAARGTY